MQRAINLLAMLASVAAIFYGVTALALGDAAPLRWPLPVLAVVVLGAVFSAAVLTSLCEASAWASDHHRDLDDVPR